MSWHLKWQSSAFAGINSEAFSQLAYCHMWRSGGWGNWAPLLLVSSVPSESPLIVALCVIWFFSMVTLVAVLQDDSLHPQTPVNTLTSLQICSMDHQLSRQSVYRKRPSSLFVLWTTRLTTSHLSSLLICHSGLCQRQGQLTSYRDVNLADTNWLIGFNLSFLWWALQVGGIAKPRDWSACQDWLLFYFRMNMK